MRREALWDRLYLSGIDGPGGGVGPGKRAGAGDRGILLCPQSGGPGGAVLPSCSDMAGLDRFWFHAPFAELAPCAIDPLVRQVTEKRYRQAADLAQDLGVRRLVIHGGFVPQVYFPEW